MKNIIILLFLTTGLFASPIVTTLQNECGNTQFLDGSHLWGFDINGDLVDRGPVTFPIFVEWTIWNGWQNIVGPEALVTNWWAGGSLPIGAGCVAEIREFPDWGDTQLTVTIHWGGVTSTGPQNLDEPGFLLANGPSDTWTWYIWCYGPWDVCSVVNCGSTLTGRGRNKH